MLQKIKQKAVNHFINIPGWRTNRKIVVIESDDWGSIRMPSKEVYKKCLKAGYAVDQIPYEKYDSLASEDDLELLFEVLQSVQDRNGRPAVITANVLTSNPDFQKIEESAFQEYHYELISDTFASYPSHSNCLNLWKQGKEAGVFYPQSHGREHLNVSMFMDALKKGDDDVLFGFRHRMPGCISRLNPRIGNKYVEALRYTTQNDKEEKFSSILEGLELFEKLFGYRSKSFTPPNYLWSPDFDQEMSERGVKYYQGNRKMKEPQPEGSVKMQSHILGEKNRFGQRYLVRNAIFEPSMRNYSQDSVNGCLKSIAAAFRMNKPAIICSHRLNYVGYLDERNRDKNLRILKHLLTIIVKRWPNVEFMTSDDLGDLIDFDE